MNLAKFLRTPLLTEHHCRLLQDINQFHAVGYFLYPLKSLENTFSRCVEKECHEIGSWKYWIAGGKNDIYPRPFLLNIRETGGPVLNHRQNTIKRWRARVYMFSLIAINQAKGVKASSVWDPTQTACWSEVSTIIILCTLCEVAVRKFHVSQLF